MPAEAVQCIGFGGIRPDKEREIGRTIVRFC